MPRSPVYVCVALTLIWTASMVCTPTVFRHVQGIRRTDRLLSGIAKTSAPLAMKTRIGERAELAERISPRHVHGGQA